MISEKSAPSLPPFPVETRARERRIYALNLCRHCGGFAHLTVRAAENKIGPGHSARNAAGTAPSEPHPLGDQAGRLAHLRRLETAKRSAPGEPSAVICVGALQTPPPRPARR